MTRTDNKPPTREQIRELADWQLKEMIDDLRTIIPPYQSTLHKARAEVRRRKRQKAKAA